MRVLSFLLLAIVVGSIPSPGSRPAIAGQTMPRTSDGLVQVVAELDDQPTARVYAGAHGLGAEDAHRMAREHTGRVDRAQRRLLPALGQIGAKVLYRTQRTYNGIGLLLPAKYLGMLETLPGIRAVHPAVQHHLTYSTNLLEVGAPTAWATTPGSIGTGQKIAIIDTGIDYTHADFGGAGTVEASSAARANTNDIESGTGFPSAKIPGGIDLVGDSYNASGDADQATPHPDPDPIDCHGHGTHVAGIAAGKGVRHDGRPFGGPYTDTGPDEGLAINPGVAPGATLYPIKIFGCYGTSALTPAAIEWAIDPNGDGDFADRMDVINMSIGAPFGSSYDASAVAADNAARAGIVVVTSGGNDGDTYYATSTPGTATHAIAVAASTGEGLASFSSRGPRRGDNAIKPDLAAPGSAIFSARNNSGAEGVALSGTSMASPHVAGAAAILRQHNPGWSVEEIKAALLNTAGPLLHNSAGWAYSPVRAGAGRLDLSRAINTTAVAFNASDPGQVSISFGSPEVVDSLSLIKHLRVTNKDLDGPAVTYRLGATSLLTTTGVTIAPTRSSVTLAPGASATVPIELSIPSGNQLGRGHDPAYTSGGQARHNLNEVAGFITLTPASSGMEQLKVAYFAAPRRAALRTATPAQLRLPEGTGILSIQLSGSSAAEPPLVSLFELQHSSPLTGTPDVEGGGVLVLGQPADLQYVGITSDAGRVSNVDQSTVAFGLATYAPWAMPSEISFEIDIDTDRDGETDYVLATSDTGPTGSGGGPGDVFTIRLRSAGGSDAVVGRVNFVEPSVDTALYRSRVLTFGVRAGLLGLTSGKTHFNYRVRTYHLDVYDPAFNLTLVDQTPTLSYNLVSSGFSVPDRDPLVAGAPIQRADATRLTLSYRTQALEANETQGVLLLHHNNIIEQQAQVLSITHGASASLGVFLPLITSGTQ